MLQYLNTLGIYELDLGFLFGQLWVTGLSQGDFQIEICILSLKNVNPSFHLGLEASYSSGSGIIISTE